MAYEIVRKKRFINRLIKVLTYVEAEWGYEIAKDFLERTDKKIDLLQQYPYISHPLGIRDTEVY
jgi:hypothetical protein